MAEEATWVKLKVEACARCGADHTMIFRPFTRPLLRGDTVWDWWGLCPALGEPVMVRSQDIEEVD